MIDLNQVWSKYIKYDQLKLSIINKTKVQSQYPWNA